MEIGDQALKVSRASIGVTQAAGLEMGVNAMSLLAQTTSTDLDEGRVLQLLNMVTAEELIDNDDYEGRFFSVHRVPESRLMSNRDLRRRQRRVREIWCCPRNEGSPSHGWKQAVCGRRQDLRQVRYA